MTLGEGAQWLRARFNRKVSQWRQERGVAWYVYVGVLILFFGGVGQAAAILIDRKSRAAGIAVAWVAIFVAAVCYGYVFYRAAKRRKRGGLGLFSAPPGC